MSRNGLHDNQLAFVAVVCLALTCGCGSPDEPVQGNELGATENSRKPLPALASVTYVILDQEGITESDFRDLELLPSLEAVYLKSPMNDESVAALAELPRLRASLEELCLLGHEFTNESLKSIDSFPKLRRLEFSYTRVNDAGVGVIASLGLKLESLKLDGSPVTDEAIPHLVKLEHLHDLDVYQTAISNEGVERLKAALPNTRFRY